MGKFIPFALAASMIGQTASAQIVTTTPVNPTLEQKSVQPFAVINSQKWDRTKDDGTSEAKTEIYEITPPSNSGVRCLLAVNKFAAYGRYKQRNTSIACYSVHPNP